MEDAQAKLYSQSVSDLVKNYNTGKKILQIRITIGKSKYNYMINGRQSQCRIIYDPLREMKIDDIGEAYICYTQSELKQIIDYMIDNYDNFATYKPNSEDVYDQPDIEIIPYTDEFDEYFEYKEDN